MSEELAVELARCYQQARAMPLPSRLVGPLGLEQAYEIQKAMVRELVAGGMEIGGYKAALTTRLTQRTFGASAPVCGVLFTQGRVASGGSIGLSGFGRMLLEVEVGYIMARDVPGPTTPRRVKALVGQVVGVVEVADLNLQGPGAPTVGDIVATNVGSRAYVVGSPVERTQVRVAGVAGQLFRDGKALGPAVHSRAALGGQWKALAWTINNVLACGWEVRKGMIIITGALGRPAEGLPGDYLARYSGGLGEVEFRVVE